MKRRARWLLVAATILASLAVSAATRAEEPQREAQWMSGESIRSAFGGRNLAGHYPSGSLWTESIFSDGTTDYREGARHWKGNWWVSDREFCFAYPPPGLGGCFRVVRASSNCYELYDFSAPAGQGEAPPAGENRWNGRMWIADEPITCEERPAV